MLYLIDGHNLIPLIPGLSLRVMDDEQRLLELLLAHKRGFKGVFEVFFDGAQPGFSGRKKFGNIVVHFVQKGRTADEAIRLRLSQVPAGSGVTVVSSDRQVRTESISRKAKVMPSQDFARLLLENRTPGNESIHNGKSMSADELADWMAMFGENPLQETDS